LKNSNVLLLLAKKNSHKLREGFFTTKFVNEIWEGLDKHKFVSDVAATHALSKQLRS